jgi:hypothetical protein
VVVHSRPIPMNHVISSKPRRSFRTWTALCLLAMPLFANAQNLIVNGTFDQNVDSWGNVAVWDGTRDANNNPNSGSDQVPVTFGGEITSTDSFQCVSVTAGKSYNLSGQILIPSALTTASGSAAIYVIWTSSPTCSFTDSVGSFATNQIGNSNALDTWYGVSATAQTAPPGAVTAFVALDSTASTAGQFTANFDNIVLEATPTPTTATAPATGTIALALCALLMLIVVGGHLRRMSRRQAAIGR